MVIEFAGLCAALLGYVFTKDDVDVSLKDMVCWGIDGLLSKPDYSESTPTSQNNYTFKIELSQQQPVVTHTVTPSKPALYAIRGGRR